MATQKGRNWSSADIVTAANLSSIERGVSAVAEEYTPTTWANGNTVTAAALNNIEQGIANAGGGGSSDFSTAEITVTGPTEENYLNVLGAMAVDYHDEEYPEDDDSYTASSGIVTSNSVLQIVMYKGKAYVDLAPYSEQTVITVSGNIEATVIENRYIITGDCTITIS